MSLLLKAFERLAKALPDRVPDPLMHADRVVGQPLARVNGIAKVRGEATFTADVPVEGLAHATMVCSTIARGVIRDIDLSRAEASPGVIAILTHRNAPRMKRAPMLLENKGASFTNAPVMQDDRIRWNGEPLAVVVAETKAQADHAASLVRVTCEADTARLSLARHLAEATPPADVFGKPADVLVGEPDRALAGAPVSVDQVYRTPIHHPAAIEPHATIAHWTTPRHLLLHDSTQAITLTQRTLARVFGLKVANVRVVCRFVGGGFGNKMGWNHQLLCAAAARLAGRPVRLALSRRDAFLALGGRTATHQRVALGADGDGRFRSLVHTGTTTMGRGRNGFPEQFTFPARHLYRADAFRIEQRVLELDTVANASMRAPGESVGGFALEGAIDELAHQLGLDPIELRRRNQPDVDPIGGDPFSARHLMDAFDAGAARFGWDRRAPRPRSRRDGEWWIGQGVAAAFYPYVRFPGTRVSLRLDADGRATLVCAAQDMGMGTATSQVQLVAERLGLPPEHVRFDYGDSRHPAGMPAAGSGQLVSITAAVLPATEALFAKLLALAGRRSPLRGLSRADLEARDGGLFVRGGDRGDTFAAILARRGLDHVEVEATAPMPFEMMKYAMHSYGAQFCEVRVSETTGEVRIARWTGVFDTGRIVNPRTAASQFRGGIVMGVGAALGEDAAFDERYGRVLAKSMADYHVPVHADIPDIDVSWLDRPDPKAPMGAKGVGEIGITGVAAAVGNAVFDATGRRLRETPFTPARLLSTPVTA